MRFDPGMCFARVRSVFMVQSQKILLVEHEPRERERLRGILGREYEVTGAACSREAAVRLSEGRFDLVLLGSMGEGVDTQVLLTGICSKAPRPKVILIAQDFTEEILTRATLLQADGVLKSFDDTEVTASVAAHLGA